MPAQKPLAYLMAQLNSPSTPFTKDWASLSDKEKAELKDYAAVEMKALGIAVAE